MCSSAFGWMCLLPAFASLAAAQSVKVNTPMPHSPLAVGENVFESDFAGARVIYRADQDAHGVYELYSAPRDGGAPAVKLNPVLPATGDVLSFLVSPDGATVLFQTKDTQYGPRTLRRVPSDGSAPSVELATNVFPDSDELFDPKDATPFDAPRFTPDGTRVVYMKPESTYEGDLLFTVPLAGGTELRLGTECDWFQLSPDGTRAVYNVSAGNQNFLWSVGSPAVGASASRTTSKRPSCASLPMDGSSIARTLRRPAMPTTTSTSCPSTGARRRAG